MPANYGTRYEPHAKRRQQTTCCLASNSSNLRTLFGNCSSKTAENSLPHAYRTTHRRDHGLCQCLAATEKIWRRRMRPAKPLAACSSRRSQTLLSARRCLARRAEECKQTSLCSEPPRFEFLSSFSMLVAAQEAPRRMFAARPSLLPTPCREFGNLPLRTQPPLQS